ncbi:MAG: hypothetical protein DRI34_01505 [Deltaproteobacteria bacterium]|nr:MAG: hypothetical protein DRI34_01505 [Deltaproteobacteria bacterium]
MIRVKISTMVLVLAMAGVARAGPSVRKLAVLDLQPQGVAAEMAATLSHVLLDALVKGGGVSVLSKSDMTRILTVEQSRQLLGCPQEDPSCVVRHGQALGNAVLVWGVVGRVGDRVVISAAAVDMQKEKTLGRESRSVAAGDGQEMIDATREIAESLRVALGLVSPASWQPIMAASAWAGGSLAGSVGEGGRLDVWQTSVELELDVFIWQGLVAFLKVGFSLGSGRDETDQSFTAYLVPAVLGVKWRWVRDWVTPYLGAGVGFGFLNMANQGGMFTLLAVAGIEIAPPSWKRFAFGVEGGFAYQRPFASRDLSRIGGRLQGGLIYRF